MTTDQFIFLGAIAAVVVLAVAWKYTPRTNNFMRLFIPGRGTTLGLKKPRQSAPRAGED